MKNRIQHNIARMQEELGERYWNVSASGIWFRKIFPAILEEHASGRLLDAGAGEMLYREMLENYCEKYESLDIEGDVDHLEDLQDMSLESNQYDTVFCRNVLEHVEDPGKALEEVERILKPGGKAIISVPHLAYLHNEPGDYYRFTRHGLKELLDRAGLETIEVKEAGGLFSFLGYIFSTILLGTTYHLPVISRVMYYFNYPLQVASVLLDRLTGNSRYLPLNYIAVVEKN